MVASPVTSRSPPTSRSTPTSRSPPTSRSAKRATLPVARVISRGVKSVAPASEQAVITKLEPILLPDSVSLLQSKYQRLVPDFSKSNLPLLPTAPLNIIVASPTPVPTSNKPSTLRVDSNIPFPITSKAPPTLRSPLAWAKILELIAQVPSI